MKQTLSVIFLFLILLKVGGFMAVLSVQREIARESVIEKMARNSSTTNLTCIVGTAQNVSKIDWEEADKEFWFEDKLYDVVKIEIKNGQIYYYCLADNDETDIVTAIQQLTQTDNSPLSETTKGIIGWVFQQIIAPEVLYPRFENYYILSKVKLGFRYDYYVFDYFFKIIKPPKTP
jgi:hypothetical protein